MLPALWSGDRVSVVPAAFADIRPGDVAVFVRNRHFVVHRVVRRFMAADGPVIITRGDAQRRDDPPVNASELLGVVAAVNRLGTLRPFRRRRTTLARGVGWTVQRSTWVRSLLHRLRAASAVRRSAATP
jgi:hypothetical protein